MPQPRRPRAGGPSSGPRGPAGAIAGGLRRRRDARAPRVRLHDRQGGSRTLAAEDPAAHGLLAAAEALILAAQRDLKA